MSTLIISRTTLQALKDKLINLGYAQEDTPFGVIQEFLVCFIIINQTNVVMEEAYAKYALPQNIQDQLIPVA